MSDPQASFGIAHILRPYPTYVADYQGEDCRTLLMLTEGGQPLDPNAGKPGYDPRLVRGLSVVMGQRIMLWLPAIRGGFAPPIDPDTLRYHWYIAFRLRNVFDFRQQRIAYHYPKQGEGVPDPLHPPAARVVIPAANECIVFNGSLPDGTMFDGASHTIAADTYKIGFRPVVRLPFVPQPSGKAEGQMQQGVLPIAGAPFPGGEPAYVQLEFAALGDELLVGLYRSSSNSDWNFNFGGIDHYLSRLFNEQLPDVGAYAMTGIGS